jgi:hypothetical protein
MTTLFVRHTVANYKDGVKSTTILRRSRKQRA